MKSLSVAFRPLLPRAADQGFATPPARRTAAPVLDRFDPPAGRGADGAAPVAAAGGTTAEQLVTELYRELLLREPDPTGRETFTGMANELLREHSPDEVRQAISDQIRASDEFAVVDVVQQSFKEVLGRAPGERGYWHTVALQMRSAGTSVEEIGSTLRAAHRGSDEYRLGHLDELVSGVYRELLRREPDPGGLATWKGEAEKLKDAGMNPTDIQAVLSGKLRGSDEYQTLEVVDRAFEELLGRTPDANGSWHEGALERRASGQSHEEIEGWVRDGIRGSEEYRQKHPSSTGWVGKVPEIDQLDPAGNAYYVNGRSNCGPASLAMVARAVGWGGNLTDEQLVMDMYRRAGTTDDGTGVQAMSGALQSIGLSTDITWGSANVDQLSADLKAGKLVIANGDFYALGVPGRVNSQDAGHYVVIEGQDENGNFIVNEPWGGQEHRVSREDLRRYLAEWNGSGPGNWVSVWP